MTIMTAYKGDGHAGRPGSSFIISSNSADSIILMRRLIAALALCFLIAGAAYAEPPLRGGVTPYGDFCPKCSKYGRGGTPVMHKEAVSAMELYFHAKGLSIGNVVGIGRFMKVDVYRHGRLVDRIIFDRRSGRIRSIY